MDEMNEGILHVLFVDLRGTFYHAFTRPTSLYGAIKLQSLRTLKTIILG